MDWSSPVANEVCAAVTRKEENIIVFQVQSLFFQHALAHTLTTRGLLKTDTTQVKYSLRITCVVLHRKHFQIEYLKWSLGFFFMCVRSRMYVDMLDGPKTVTITANLTQIRRPATRARSHFSFWLISFMNIRSYTKSLRYLSLLYCYGVWLRRSNLWKSYTRKKVACDRLVLNIVSFLGSFEPSGMSSVCVRITSFSLVFYCSR